MEALESDFDYDKDYINDCMGWKPAAAPATAQNSSATATFNGHTGATVRLISSCSCEFQLARDHSKYITRHGLGLHVHLMQMMLLALFV